MAKKLILSTAGAGAPTMTARTPEVPVQVLDVDVDTFTRESFMNDLKKVSRRIKSSQPDEASSQT